MSIQDSDTLESTFEFADEVWTRLPSAWADIASLTTTTADMALTIKDHPIRTRARTWVIAAQAISTTGGPHPPLDTATAASAQPQTEGGQQNSTPASTS